LAEEGEPAFEIATENQDRRHVAHSAARTRVSSFCASGSTETTGSFLNRFRWMTLCAWWIPWVRRKSPASRTTRRLSWNSWSRRMLC